MTGLKTAFGIAATCGLLGVAPTACGDDAKDASSSPTTTETATKETATTETTAAKARRRGASVKVMNTRYGRMLFDGRGRALYLFTREASPRSRCYGGCATAWPPFLTRAKPRAGNGAKATLLGTTKRRDGKTQVTYNGHPLYYYVTDRKPGQVTCQDVTEFGGTWLVVSPSGSAIQ
jgi:predicted lipoprotein with Yx(FWY)xxD motif